MPLPPVTSGSPPYQYLRICVSGRRVHRLDVSNDGITLICAQLMIQRSWLDPLSLGGVYESRRTRVRGREQALEPPNATGTGQGDKVCVGTGGRGRRWLRSVHGFGNGVSRRPASLNTTLKRTLHILLPPLHRLEKRSCRGGPEQPRQGRCGARRGRPPRSVLLPVLHNERFMELSPYLLRVREWRVTVHPSHTVPAPILHTSPQRGDAGREECAGQVEHVRQEVRPALRRPRWSVRTHPAPPVRWLPGSLDALLIGLGVLSAARCAAWPHLIRLRKEV